MKTVGLGVGYAQFSTNGEPMKFEIRRLLAAASLVLACGISTAADDVDISLAHGGPAETQVVSRLRSLLSRYDLSPWTITRQVIIDQDEIPHSHPVLTLHARHRNDDELLLSTYVHEQLHWWLATRPKQTAEAEAELRLRYPKIPVGYPDGSSDADGNYEHLLVIYLEYRADQTLLGELKAREVMQFWASDHYTWLYEKVLSEPDVIGRVVKKYGLLPPRA